MAQSVPSFETMLATATVNLFLVCSPKHIVLYCSPSSLANVLDEHRIQSEEAGCDGFITKPLTPTALADIRARAEAMAARRHLTA
jgi:hypothetical protein